MNCIDAKEEELWEVTANKSEMEIAVDAAMVTIDHSVVMSSPADCISKTTEPECTFKIGFLNLKGHSHWSENLASTIDSLFFWLVFRSSVNGP